MISGLVVQLSDHLEEQEQFFRAVTEQPQFELGTTQGLRVPLVLETADADAANEWTQWLMTLPAVLHTDVTFVSLESLSPTLTVGGEAKARVDGQECPSYE